MTSSKLTYSLRFPLAVLTLSLACHASAFAQAEKKELPDGTEAAVKAMAGFRVPAGMKVELFAAEPKLASPVAFCLDEKGRVYVAEEYRFNLGTEENRTRPFLLDDDLQLKTVDDRLAMFKKFADEFPGGMEWFSKTSDQVRLLEDRDGDGRADRSTIFAGGFNGPLDGLAAGVIAREGNIYLTNIPNLWLLRDEDGDGVAEVRKALLHGFGVNAAFLGHDLHGLVWGPDGKLYFSVGDRGFHVKTQEGTVLSGPRTGAIFRCYPDGSQLEVVARGLRNPQELAFDEYGNLFADDNNCDKGDHSRLVYVVEGGDSGWNMAHQTIPEPYLTGPWHAERLWHLPHAGQPAWILPPVGKLGAGPSGFAYYPGTGLPERYAGHFFMCNYTGNGGVEAFGVRPLGAGFEIVDEHDFAKPLSATDVEFGYDGKVYISDFVKLEWNGGSGGGRIYTLHDPEQTKSDVVKQTTRLFKEGFKQRGDDELAALLSHADMRVRQRAQFALAERGEKAIGTFVSVLEQSDALLPRLHAVWGLGQIGVKHPEALRHVAKQLVGRTSDASTASSSPILRAQAAKVLGDCRYPPAADTLMSLLKDEDLHVRLHAAIALGKLRHKPALGAVSAMLAENNDKDPFLRHAGVMALLGIDDSEGVQARAKDRSAAVRMAVLLVQRRIGDPRVVQFLADDNVLLVAEAARAINDVPIEKGTADLARLADRLTAPDLLDNEPLLRRIINANFRLGLAENVERVAALASNRALSPTMRSEALAALSDWEQPSQRDRVNWVWRPLPTRVPLIAKWTLEPKVAELLSSTSGELQIEAIKLVGKLQLQVDIPRFASLAGDAKTPLGTRIAALNLLADRKYPELRPLVTAALAAKQPELRSAARQVLAGLDPAAAVESLKTALDEPAATTGEKQSALATLAAIKLPPADSVLDTWSAKLATNDAPLELHVDLVEAITARGTAPGKQALAKYEAALPKDDLVARSRAALAGGNAERGKAIFIGHRAAQCIRCHKVGGQGGDAGPDLSKVAVKNDRQYLLQSVLDPSAKIAPGFGSVTLVLDDGRVLAGVIKSEENGKLTLVAPNGRTITVAADEIDERTAAKSAMPTAHGLITPRELRDLIEYLATLK